MGLLFVCTGNLCRSPFAERRTVALLGDRLPGQVGSAGTAAPVGQPMDPSATLVLAEYGASAKGHRARGLTDELVEQAELVLTMTTTHRTAVLELSPGALRRTFTLLEAVALLEQVEDIGAQPGGDGFGALARRLAGARAALPLPHPGFDDVPDPIGRPLAVHREVAAVIDAALRSLLPLTPRGG